MKSKPRRSGDRLIKLSLFLFGSFCFGLVLGAVYHELGHAIAMWVTGGQVARITINPFSWSYTYYASVPTYPIFTSWSGALIGSLLGLVVILIARNIPSPYAVPFFFSGTGVMINSGSYYVLDPYLVRSGDPTFLIKQGVPIYLVLMTGFILLIAGIYFLVGNIGLIGIKVSDSLLLRIVILGWGIFPYAGLSALYTIWYEPADVFEAMVDVILVILFIVLVALLSMKLGHGGKTRNVHIKWSHVIYAVVLGVSALVVPLLMFKT